MHTRNTNALLKTARCRTRNYDPVQPRTTCRAKQRTKDEHEAIIRYYTTRAAQELPLFSKPHTLVRGS